MFIAVAPPSRRLVYFERDRLDAGGNCDEFLCVPTYFASPLEAGALCSVWCSIGRVVDCLHSNKPLVYVR